MKEARPTEATNIEVAAYLVGLLYLVFGGLVAAMADAVMRVGHDGHWFGVGCALFVLGIVHLILGIGMTVGRHGE